MLAPDPRPAAAPKILQETVCKCGQPIVVLQQGKDTVAMHKKPACREWERHRQDGMRGLNRARTQPSQQPTNRHARRRAAALARKGKKP